MPPQKNSGNRAKKTHKESSAIVKSRKEVEEIFKNILDLNENKHVCRVVKKLGNGRFEIFYVTREGERIVEHTDQATIRGSFRGKAKRDLWVDVGIFVIAEENLGLEITGLLSRQEMKEIVSTNKMYKKVLSGEDVQNDDYGIEFDERSDEEEESKLTDAVSKKDKKKHNRENIPVDISRDDLDVNIDDI